MCLSQSTSTGHALEKDNLGWLSKACRLYKNWVTCLPTKCWKIRLLSGLGRSEAAGKTKATNGVLRWPVVATNWSLSRPATNAADYSLFRASKISDQDLRSGFWSQDQDAIGRIQNWGNKRTESSQFNSLRQEVGVRGRPGLDANGNNEQSGILKWCYRWNWTAKVLIVRNPDGPPVLSTSGAGLHAMNYMETEKV